MNDGKEQKTGRIEVYDTTLRDGSQGEGVNFSVADKLRVAEKLDHFGMDFIEGGWPGSNPKDVEFFRQARDRDFQHAKLAAFGSTRRKDYGVEDDPQVKMLIDAGTPVVTIFGKSWILHVKDIIRTTPEENVRMIFDTVKYLKSHGIHVIYDGEHAFDGYKNDAEYALSTFAAAAEAGADCVVLCDTNGGCLPEEVAEITAVVKSRIICPVGIHTHDDCGLGVANALASIRAGAAHIQGTVNGYGERTGNCNLTSAIPNIAFKMGIPCIPQESLCHLRELSNYVDEIANIRHNPRQPWVGSTAFAHKGGMHVNAVHKVPHSFEHIDPHVVGNERRILVSDLSGKSNILIKARELGFDIDDSTLELKEILDKVKEREHEGFEYEAAEASLKLLIQKILEHRDPPFSIRGYHVSMRRDEGHYSVCQATIKVEVDGQTAHTVAEGDGPVNALDEALRLALSRFFPQLQFVKLTDYKVRILGGSQGTAATTRVLIESTDGNDEWGTVGASENIIEASLQALRDSMEFALMK
jgi:2-isopropylmalate synthase